MVRVEPLFGQFRYTRNLWVIYLVVGALDLLTIIASDTTFTLSSCKKERLQVEVEFNVLGTALTHLVIQLNVRRIHFLFSM